MKKLMCLLCCFSLFLIGMMGCGKAGDPEGLFGYGPTLAANPLLRITDPSEIPFLYSNQPLLTGLPGGSFCDIGTALLFVHYDRLNSISLLYEYDKASGTVGTFCKDSVCNHQSASCAAFGIFGNLELYGGRVYAARTIEGSMGDVPTELKNGRFVDVNIRGTLSSFRHYGDDLYGFTASGAFARFDGGAGRAEVLRENLPYSNHWLMDGFLYSGGVGEASDGRIIYRINLNEAPYESETILRDIGEGAPRTDGVHIYFYNIQGELQRTDPDGGNITRLPAEQATFPVFDEEYIYYSRYNWNDITDPGNGEVYRLKKDLSAERELLFELESWANIYPIYGTDILFVSTRAGGGETVYYTVRNDGRELTRVELP